jgi:MATH domain
MVYLYCSLIVLIVFDLQVWKLFLCIDTLHRFWKKEHDWGWKKFMELSKVNDGFIDDDNLTIKAQVQVIR